MSTSCYFFDLVRKIRDQIKVGYLDHLGQLGNLDHHRMEKQVERDETFEQVI